MSAGRRNAPDMAPYDDLLTDLRSSTVTDPEVLVREVRMRIGVLTNFVTIRIYYNGRGSEPYVFETDSIVRTGAHREAHEVTQRAFSESEALRRAVRMLTEEYECAVRSGEMPDDAWLVHTARR